MEKKNGKKKAPVDVSSYLSEETGMLTSLRARRAQLLLRETESHPDVVMVNEEIQELEKKVGTLHTMTGADGQTGVSGSAWENFLESNIKMDKGLLADLEQERSSARITADSNLENLIVIDPATRPTRPEMAKGLKIGVMGIVGGLGGGGRPALSPDLLPATGPGRVPHQESFRPSELCQRAEGSSPPYSREERLPDSPGGPEG